MQEYNSVEWIFQTVLGENSQNTPLYLPFFRIFDLDGLFSYFWTLIKSVVPNLGSADPLWGRQSSQ